MKITKKISLIFIAALLFIPQMRFVEAASTPDYVGIEENDVLIYNVFINADPFEDYLEDLGYSITEIENISDSYFDDEWDEDITGWRYAILKIEEEDEYHIEGEKYDGVPYKFNFYIRESGGDWEEEDSNEEGALLKYDVDYYVYRTSEMMGLYYLIGANNINWRRVVSQLNEEYDKDWDGEDQKAEATVESHMYYFRQRYNGLTVVWNPDDDIFEDFSSTSRYNDDGVLIYYDWNYGGETILNLVLQGTFFYYYGWIVVIGSIAGVAILILIITLVVIPGKKKGKKVKIPAAPVVEKTPEPAPAAPAVTSTPPGKQFCPHCGSRVAPEATYCAECGSRIED